MARIQSESRWPRRQKKQRYWIAIVAVAIGVVVVIVLIVLAYKFDWTGFNSHIGPKLDQNQQYRPEKTLWDWLQLLIVPLVLAIGGFWFSQRQKTTEQRSTTDNQHAAALQAYIDKISELLLKEEGLGKLTADDQLKPEYDNIRNIARVRTVTILTQLDAKRIGYVFTFLLESGLMSKESNRNIISLRRADLSKVNWSQANLKETNLSEVDLRDANLRGADLKGANLSNVSLIQANLRGADLRDANLRGADLRDANLRGAGLIQANLSGADLREANLRGAGLGEANLSGADLGEAKLWGTVLRDANLSGASLYGAKFFHTNLGDADLSNAFLINAKVAEEQLKEAKSLQGATMPDGSKHP